MVGRGPAMKRSLMIFFSFVFIFSATVDGKKTTQPRRKSKTRYAKTSTTSAAYCPDVKTITECQAGGRPKPGDAPFRFDPKLNEKKNIPSDPQPAVKHDFARLQSRSDPDRTKFTEQNKEDRSILKGLGEGDKVTVVAYALAARVEGQETSNCGLSDPKDTDVHIVLVDPLQNPTLTNDEKDSETAEFTPRVRLNHPNLTQAKLEPLIASYRIADCFGSLAM